MSRASAGAAHWVGIITLLPELFEGVAEYGVTRRAFAEGLQCEYFNPRDFTERKHGQVDDKPYGGGPGMVMQPQPLEAALSVARQRARESTPGSVQESAVAPKPLVIVPSPQGETLTQTLVQKLAQEPALIFICGRYEGIDERVVEHADLEISLGDFVLTGGELAVQVILDAVSRWLPGTLGNRASASADSFADGLLEGPQYTRPEATPDGRGVPAVLVSGDHAAIDRYRRKMALQRTYERRPELLLRAPLSGFDRELLAELLAEGLAEGSVE